MPEQKTPLKQLVVSPPQDAPPLDGAPLDKSSSKSSRRVPTNLELFQVFALREQQRKGIASRIMNEDENPELFQKKAAQYRKMYETGKLEHPDDVDLKQIQEVPEKPIVFKPKSNKKEETAAVNVEGSVAVNSTTPASAKSDLKKAEAISESGKKNDKKVKTVSKSSTNTTNDITNTVASNSQSNVNLKKSQNVYVNEKDHVPTKPVVTKAKAAAKKISSPAKEKLLVDENSSKNTDNSKSSKTKVVVVQSEPKVQAPIPKLSFSFHDKEAQNAKFGSICCPMSAIQDEVQYEILAKLKDIYGVDGAESILDDLRKVSLATELVGNLGSDNVDSDDISKNHILGDSGKLCKLQWLVLKFLMLAETENENTNIQICTRYKAAVPLIVKYLEAAGGVQSQNQGKKNMKMKTPIKDLKSSSDKTYPFTIHTDTTNYTNDDDILQKLGNSTNNVIITTPGISKGSESKLTHDRALNNATINYKILIDGGEKLRDSETNTSSIPRILRLEASQNGAYDSYFRAGCPGFERKSKLTPTMILVEMQLLKEVEDMVNNDEFKEQNTINDSTNLNGNSNASNLNGNDNLNRVGINRLNNTKYTNVRHTDLTSTTELKRAICALLKGKSKVVSKSSKSESSGSSGAAAVTYEFTSEYKKHFESEFGTRIGDTNAHNDKNLAAESKDSDLKFNKQYLAKYVTKTRVLHHDKSRLDRHLAELHGKDLTKVVAESKKRKSSGGLSNDGESGETKKMKK